MDFITVVSGLPRSGTSMMMQILEAGGMPILTDHIRKSDEDNPRGYYEFEPVKKNKDDPSWVSDGVGKAVKMVYRLLYDLPKDFEYRVIFMRRNIEEVLVSQAKMLKRNAKKGADISDERMAKLLENELENVENWLDEQDNFSVISVDYNEMIESPKAQCKKVSEFLAGKLNINKMPLVVDASLYRSRK